HVVTVPAGLLLERADRADVLGADATAARGRQPEIAVFHVGAQPFADKALGRRRRELNFVCAFSSDSGPAYRIGASACVLMVPPKNCSLAVRLTRGCYTVDRKPPPSSSRFCPTMNPA